MDTPKVALVTGGNKGIGLAVVRALCKQFTGDVHLTARDVGRGTAAVEHLKLEGLEPLFHQLDITDPASVNAARDYFQKKYDGVDVLINNAGIAFKGADTTPFGIQAEMTLKTNFFANRDMCSVFLPIMKPGGRVVNVSSVMGEIALGRCSTNLQTQFRSGAITEDELVLLMEQFIKDAQKSIHLEEGWTDTAYGVSKIGLTVLSRILAHRLRQDRPQDNILLNSCCPGWVKTDMSGNNGPLTPEQGADTPVYLALLPPGADEPHGQYLKERKVHDF